MLPPPSRAQGKPTRRCAPSRESYRNIATAGRSHAAVGSRGIEPLAPQRSSATISPLRQMGSATPPLKRRRPSPRSDDFAAAAGASGILPGQRDRAALHRAAHRKDIFAPSTADSTMGLAIRSDSFCFRISSNAQSILGFIVPVRDAGLQATGADDALPAELVEPTPADHVSSRGKSAAPGTINALHSSGSATGAADTGLGLPTHRGYCIPRAELCPQRRPESECGGLLEDARHGLAFHDSAIGMRRNRRNVVSQKDPFPIRRPRQKGFVASPCQSDILRSHNIEIAACAGQCAQDVIIEILVGKPAQHGYRCRRSSNRARIPSGSHRDSLDLPMASAASPRFARYPSTMAGRPKQYPIA